MEHEALIAKLAHSLYRKTHLYGFEDLFQVGLQSAVRLDKCFDESRAKKTTFYTLCVRRDMIKFIKRHNHHFNDTRVFNLSKVEEAPFWECLPDLNEQEDKIIALLMEGVSKKEIAKELGISSRDLKLKIEKIGRRIDA